MPDSNNTKRHVRELVKENRIQVIKDLILKQKKVNVNVLSKELGVSEVTVRNYLDILESENFVRRFHGGAALNENYANERHDFSELTYKLPVEEEKEKIGKMAASLIEDDEWVFLGQGTTCCHIAKALVHRGKLKIMTNNLKVAAILAENSMANVVLTGGTLVHEHQFMSGEIFKKSMENVFISKSFIGAAGVDLRAGYTVSGMTEVSVNELIKKISQQCFVVFDKSKINTLSFMSWGGLDVADAVITNSDIPREYKEYYEDHNISLYYV